ncbi:GNAT family N-acetyltransferase [Bacillus spongiae]|uniref:GNAT family N-acetyltransferase n=1 Tax=Bacillus spongiae TaxID=2683610 RepID=A0ABU8HBL9_9BACI
MDMKMDVLTNDDIRGIIMLSASVGWDYDEHEVSTVMASGKVIGHRNEQGHLVSCGAVIPYGDRLASIGMIIVHPAYQGKGLGREVTESCLQSISTSTTVMLIATAEGKPMYEGMGFQVVESVHKYIRNKDSSRHSNEKLEKRIVPMKAEDMAQVIEIDKGAFGENRATFLKNRIKQAKEAVVVKSEDGKIIGYSLSILGPVNLIIGPIVAPSKEWATRLIDRLALNHHGNVRIDVPKGHPELMVYLERVGFEKVSEPPVMVKNTTKLPKRNHTLFGIAAQVFG